MGINDFLFGTPPTTGVQVVGGSRPPGFAGARDWSDYLSSWMGQPFAPYPGQVDPGLSPTMQALMSLGQGYAASPAPAILGQAAGTLGRFMTPSWSSAPANFAAPQFFHPPSFGGWGGPGGAPAAAGSPPQQMGGAWNLAPQGGGYGSMTGGGLMGPGGAEVMPYPSPGSGGGMGAGLAMAGGSQGVQAPSGPPSRPFGQPGFRPNPLGGGGASPAFGGGQPTLSMRGAQPSMSFGRLPMGAPSSFGGGASLVGGGGAHGGAGPYLAYRAPGGSGSAPFNPGGGEAKPSGGVFTRPAIPSTSRPPFGNMTPGFEPGGVFTRPKPAAPSTGRPGLPGAPDVAGQFQAQYGGAMGQVRPGAGGGQEILLGQGWVPLNPSDPGHQFAQMAFNRYGANWAGGSPAGYHSTDTLGAFQAVYGRPPTQQEQMDLYYRGGGQDLMRQAAALPASAWSFMASPNQAFLQQWRARHGGG